MIFLTFGLFANHFRDGTYFGKEKHLPNLHFEGSMLVFRKFSAALQVEEISLWPPAELESLPGQQRG